MKNRCGGCILVTDYIRLHVIPDDDADDLMDYDMVRKVGIPSLESLESIGLRCHDSCGVAADATCLARVCHPATDLTVPSLFS